MVQLSAFKPAAHVHHPSVCRHVSLLQLGEHCREHLLPKYPSSQARGKWYRNRSKVIQTIKKNPQGQQKTNNTDCLLKGHGHDVR